MSSQPEGPPAGLPPPESLAGPTQEERTLGMLCHLGGLFTSIVLPLVLWLVKKDQSRFVAEHGKEALNFQIALIIYYGVALVLTVILIGILLFLAILVFEIVVVIQACQAATRGEMYRYPYSIRFIKD